MIKPLLLLTIILVTSCAHKKQDWEIQWEKHSQDFKKVIQLIKENKLNSRGNVYKIPDSINIKYPLEENVFSHKDSSNDSSCTLTFYLDTLLNNTKNPSIVYTNNERIIEFYKKPPFEVIKIENYWYFVNYR